MLGERHNINQATSCLNRRWFDDADTDLIIWQDGGGNIHSFQLYYGKQGVNTEQAIIWDIKMGYTLGAIDDGESRQLDYKKSPILVAGDALDVKKLIKAFIEISKEIDQVVARFVVCKLQEYKRTRERVIDVYRLKESFSEKLE